MPEGQPITRELSLSEVVSKTFQLYGRDFVKYLILFLIIEAIIGVLTSVLQRGIVLPLPPVNATPQETLAWASSFLEASAALVAITGLVTWVFYPIAYGTAVKLASEQIEKGYVDFALSVRYAVSQLLWMWVVGIVVGILVILGFIALIVPGIILSIMFSLVLPIIVIERSGFQSLGISR
ncbi:MAG: hypothetical protein M1368_08580, partial [Thaumarchaeota archaeon]|nr:hypothetical protein [Nitrososphaerota archaeon]